MSKKLVDMVGVVCKKILPQKSKGPEEIVKENLQTIKKVFYKTFSKSRYDVKETNVFRSYLAYVKGDKDWCVHFTSWNCDTLNPRLSVVNMPGITNKTQEDIRKLADKLEGKSMGYLSWECDFGRYVMFFLAIWLNILILNP